VADNVIRVCTKSKSYDIIIGERASDRLIGVIDGISPDAALTLISDSNVYALYGERFESMLESAGKTFFTFVIPAGEGSKRADTLFSILEFMAEKGMTRSDLVVALGGGVVGDITGFASSIYQRGIRFIQMPTTVLAMSDSSVGGKTAVDLNAGKNLAGSFWQPEAVICDLSFAGTLPDDVFRDGCAEVIKYGVILDEEMFERLEGGIDNCFEYAITRSIEIKRDIVSEDERDGGVRGLLNFGHTFGHAIEKLSGYSVSHGSAVAKGMVIACKAAAALGMCDITDRVSSLLTSYGFDLSVGCTAEELFSAMRSDKKRNGDKITLILPEKLGKCALCPMPLDRVREILESVRL